MAAEFKIKKKPTFRSILLHIKKNLTKEDRKDLVYLKQLPKKDTEECEQDFYHFLDYMSNRPNDFGYGEDDPWELFEDLNEIGRQDICNTVMQKYEELKQYKDSQTRSQGQGSTSPCGSGTPAPNPPSPGLPVVGSNISQGPIPSPSTPLGQLPAYYPVSPPHNSPRYHQGGTSPGAIAYEPPCKVPGSQFQGSTPEAFPTTSPRATSFEPPCKVPGSQFQGSTPAASPTTSPRATAYDPPCKVPGSQSQGSTPAASPTSGNPQQSSALSPNPGAGTTSSHGLKSTEPLPPMPSNVVQMQGLPSDQSSVGVVHANIGQDVSSVSLPRSLKINEPVGNPAAVDHGLKSSEPLRTMQSSMEPGQGKPASATPAHPSPANSNSVISTASPLTSNDPAEIGHSGNANAEQLSHSSSGSMISSARSLRTSDEQAASQIQIRAPSSLRAAGNMKHTLEYVIQPSSTPDHLRDVIQRLLLELSLIEEEEIGTSVKSNPSQQQPVIGEGDTVRDCANAPSRAEVLPADVVRDSASDPEQVGESAAGALDSSILDFPQPPTDKKVILRGYQVELADPGLQGVNYVICAPTGSGKTITAAQICYKNMMKMKEAGKEDDFKAIFIVPTRHLKKQQRDCFQDLFVSGQVTSLAEGQMFRDALGKGNVRVLMITAQVLVNALTQNEFKLPEVSMLIFDECHHTTLNHPYNEIMRHYMMEKKAVLVQQGIPEEQWPVGQPVKRPQGGIPQVVGLTASVGTGTSDDAHGHIVTLCANLDSSEVKIVTEPENVQEMKQCNKTPEEDRIIPVPKRELTPESSRFIKILETVMGEIKENVLNKHQDDFTSKGIAFYSPAYGTQEYENWIAKIRACAELRFPNLEICANYLFRLNLALLLYNDLRAKDALESMEIFKLQTKGKQDELRDGRHCRMIYEKNLQELTELASKENPLSNPKLLCLHEMIKRVYSKEPESKGIVLARTRFATYALLNFIKDSEELKKLRPPIQPVRIVGQSREIDQGLTLTRQEAALDAFKSDQANPGGVTRGANLLVATDIVQEGLDIPACNVIIRYNFVSNEIGTVQAKGRARKEGSKCYLIVERGSVNEAREHKNRERVTEMDKAIREANALPKHVWHQEIRQRQLTIIRDIEEKEERERIQQEESQHVDVKLLCRGNDCGKFICKSSDLERRLSNYTCRDPTIIADRTSIVRTSGMTFKESRRIGILECKCGNQLGQVLEFKRQDEWKLGYNLSPKSFFFMYNDDPDSKRVFAKWKKVDFHIASEMRSSNQVVDP
ncbi:interferon-induced helicase C domain-containing protein 1 isoform X2 [Strongylocentrotus purpuratus]|uniref:RNA helicase n=1 Tax=Strongylocentrotus purpuratus TaxID=7668 RepID=A0A7M7SUE8_STRPU|nr:interferon-induced helicase C domain-containing protein 1 isoform X2 [Strongylocentrotus purpuratus]